MTSLTARPLAGLLLPLFCILLLALPPSTLSAQPLRFIEGTHYLPLENPIATAGDSDKPQLTEVFWYGCSACYAFDPLLNQWLADRQEEIAFDRVPAAWNRNTVAHARLFYAAAQLGLQQQMHTQVFDSIHQQGRRLLSEAEQLSFLQSHGAGEAEAEKALNSFSVDSSIRKAESLARQAGVASIPALIVNGRYLVNGSNLSSYRQMLELVEYLLSAEDN